MTVLAIQRLRDGVPTSADTATLSIINSIGSVVFPTTVIPPTSPGSYSYETSSLSVGSYTATWIFITSGLPTDTVSRAFTVDRATEISEGVTLMELERLVAQRIGPFRRLRCVALGSTTVDIAVPRLKSSLNIGDYEDQYVLRRGLTYGDELIQGFQVEDDRVRQVSLFTPNTGILTVDQAYSNVVDDDEAIEVFAVDPEFELRPAVLAGLKRCFFWDTVSISVTGSGVYNVNLTASVPWITQVNQVGEVQLSYPSQLLPPRRMQWAQPYRDGKDIKLYTKGGAVGTITVKALRPVYSLVNRETSLTGPNDDLDALAVDPDYAAWAGVLECWKAFPEVLTPLAAQNMRPTRQEAAQEFTKLSMTLVEQVPEYRQIDYGAPDLVQIGNLAEPVT